MKISLWISFGWLFAMTAQACIWDAGTLLQEKSRNHDLAKAILGKPPAPENPQKLKIRIKNLEANRDENNPDWWNNLAGAYLRLNQPAIAMKLLEPVVSKFPNYYGIHANLGTAFLSLIPLAIIVTSTQKSATGDEDWPRKNKSVCIRVYLWF